MDHQARRKHKLLTTLPPYCVLPSWLHTQEGREAYHQLWQKERVLCQKRLLDCLLAVPLLVVSLPVQLLIGCLVYLEDGGPVFFPQERVGRYGIPFIIWKFRTMQNGSETKGQLTLGQDTRITHIGTFLRHVRLDELPQLWNIVKGEMSFVGPRPEVGKFVAGYTPAMAATLLVPPGLTGRASLLFREEGQLLHGVDANAVYRNTILPKKMKFNQLYLKQVSLREDWKILWETAMTLFGRSAHSGICRLKTAVSTSAARP